MATYWATPHALQNFAPAASAALQLPHVAGLIDVPQRSQKRASARFVLPHFRQINDGVVDVRPCG